MPASAAVDLARHEWLESRRRFDAEALDPRRGAQLHRQLDVLMEELRRRVGQWFTLAELADAYTEAEVWSRDVIAERAPAGDWIRTLSLVEGAAFHLYSRGAIDYSP